MRKGYFKVLNGVISELPAFETRETLQGEQLRFAVNDCLEEMFEGDSGVSGGRSKSLGPDINGAQSITNKSGKCHLICQETQECPECLEYLGCLESQNWRELSKPWVSKWSECQEYGRVVSNFKTSGIDEQPCFKDCCSSTKAKTDSPPSTSPPISSPPSFTSTFPTTQSSAITPRPRSRLNPRPHSCPSHTMLMPLISV